MRIAITADPYLPVPPTHYGGIERIIDFLVRGLVARGHDVTLMAHPDSATDGALIPYGAPPHESVLQRAAELWQVGSNLFRLRGRVDVVHSFGRLAALAPILPLSSIAKIQSYQRRIPVRGVRRAARLAGDSLHFTACSTSMYENFDVDGEWSTVFNGVDTDKFTFVPSVPADAPLVFLGRIEPIKGTHDAIAIANRASRRLVIAGNVSDPRYYEEKIAPFIDDDRVRYVGPVDDVQKNALLGAAFAFLMPIGWNEPFGIVMAEALACGTPVVGFDRGSVREVVRDGVNGFICDGVDDAAAALGRVGALCRRDVRRDACERFSSQVVVAAYESLYRSMVERAS